MNNTQGALYFSAGIDMTQWRNNVNEMRRDILGLKNTTQAETRQMDTSFRNLGMGLATYFSGAALGNFANQIINVRGEFQKTEIAFGTMLKSTDKAKELMGQMVELAAKTPFSLQDVSQGAKQLLAFQVPADQVVDTLTRMGNIAAGLGVPLGRINLVYGQVMAKGKLAGDDLRQFTEAGIPMLAELAKKFNTNTAAISKMVTEGKIGFKDVKDVLFSLTNEGGMFFNLMEKQSASLSGRMSNLSDTIDQMMNKMGQSSEGFLNDAIDSAAYLVENYETVIEVVGVAVATYGTYRAALIATAAWQQLSAGAALQQALAQGTLTTAQSYGAAATVALQRAQIGLNAAMMANPIGVIIGLVAGLTYVIYKNVTATTAWEEIQNRLNENVARHSESIVDQKVKIQSLIDTIKEKKTSDKDAAAALVTLNGITGNRIKGLTVEGIRLGQNTKAIGGYIEMLKLEARAKALIDSRIAAEKDNQRIDRDDPNRLTVGERLGNFDSVNDIGKTAQQRKAEAMMLGRMANNKAMREADAELLKLRQQGVNPIIEQGKDDAAAINTSGVEVKKAAEKKARDLAEVFSLNSIADINQRISLWNEALDKASGDNVQELTKNKFGDTVKTGNIVTVAKAMEEREKLVKAADKRMKEITKLSFDEELDEIKRQTEKRDLLLQNKYSKEEVDEIFPQVKDKGYLKYLEETAFALDQLRKSGDKTKETADKILEVQSRIEDFKGHKSYIDGVAEAIENLKKKYSGLELIEKLDDFGRIDPGNSTEAERNAMLQATEKAKDEVRKTMEQSYLQLLEQQRTYEEKSLALQVKYDGLRALAKNDAEMAKIEAGFKAEKSAIDAEVFKNSGLYAQAFGNLEKAGVRTLVKLRDQLRQYLDVNKDLSPENIKVIQEAIEKIDATIGDRNPFLKLSNAIDEYKKKRKELADAEKKYGKESDQHKQKLDEVGVSFGNAAAAAGEMASIFLGAVQDIGNAFGSLSDEANQTLTQVQDLLDGVMDAVKGYLSGNYIQMLAGIVQIISAIVKLANGDNQRAKNISTWQRDVNELSLAYERLQQIIEKTAGEEALSKQRELISNLQKQQEILRKMRNTEYEKKNPDHDKAADYTNQIAEINYQIEQLVDSFKESITTTTFKDLAQEMADALTEAYGKGEDAALAYEKVVENVMRNAVANALKVKFIQPLAEEFVNKLYNSMGFGGSDDALILTQIQQSKDTIAALEAKLSAGGLGIQQTAGVKATIKTLQEKIAALNAQLAANQQAGVFDGLTQDEIDLLTGDFKNDPRFQAYLDGIKGLDELFDSSLGAAEGMKGGIEAVTEKTAGALEAQINAIRQYQVEAVNIQKSNKTIFENSLKNLVMIEYNTRPLIRIDKNIEEMNSKMKKSLAGVP